MGRGLPATSVVVIALAVVPSPAAAASADRQTVIPPEPPTAEIGLAGSGGYRVDLSATGGSVAISATRGGASSEYEVPGRFSRNGIEARIGRLGRISVDFRERRVKRIPSRAFGCTGPPEVVRVGVFVGRIRFRGERAYTRVDVRRAVGRISTVPRWRCAGGSGAKSEVPDHVDLAASCGRRGLVAYGRRSVDQGPPVFPDEEASTSFVAASLERLGRVHVFRLAIARGGRSAFLFDDAFSFATLKPPPPFHGVGMLTRDPAGGGFWTGSLSVAFPGREMSLIDRRFRVGLARYREERVEGRYVLPPRAPCAADRDGETVAQLSRALATVAG